MELRWYQTEALQATYDYFFKHTAGNPLIALPTGTGKSFVIARFIQDSINTYIGVPQKYLVLTHVKELIEQNLAELLRCWPTAPAGVYSASLKRKEHHNPITFAGIASVYKKASLFGHVDLVFIDEAHLVSQNGKTMYRKFLDELTKFNPMIRVIGLTATHYRLGLGMLTEGGLFDEVCYDLTTPQSFQRLIREGYMAPLITKRTALQYDTEGVRTTGGEFNQRDLQSAVDKEDLTHSACEEMVRYGHDRDSWLVFSSGIAHCEHIYHYLANVLKIKATYVHSKISAEERDLRLSLFKSGHYQALVNNTIYTTGFNYPDLDLIAVLSPTKSASKWVQMLGRGTRPARYKTDCLVLDFAGNTARLGPIDDPVLPTLKEKGTGTAPVKVCEHCMTYNHANATKCCECGAEFPRYVRLEKTASNKDVMSSGEFQLLRVKVDRIMYSKHQKKNGIASLLVIYFCGLQMYREWVCLQHGGRVQHKAWNWWRLRSNEPAPQTIDQALQLTGSLREPKEITVRSSKAGPYMEIRQCHFMD